MKNFILTSVMLMINFVCIAQISVSSFVQLNDADARVNHPVIDQDGAACALIKIVTSAQDFTFDAGQLEIVKVSYEHAGEVWVYVPEGAMKLKISHQDLGSLRGADVHNDGYYYFPTNRLKRATSYRMELTHKEVVKFIEGNGETSAVSFKVNVDNAEVWIGEKKAGLVENGQFNTTWPKNLTLEYRIHKDRYEDVSGKFKCEKDNIVESVELIPYFGTLTVSTSQSAEIFLNNQKLGNGYVSRDLDPGTYKVEIKQRDKKSIQKLVVISRDKKETVTAYPEDLYADVDISSTPRGASVSLDGTSIGSTPLKKKIVAGEHKLVISKVGYRSKSTSAYFQPNKNERLSFILQKSTRFKQNMMYLGAGYRIIGNPKVDINMGWYWHWLNIELFGSIVNKNAVDVKYNKSNATSVVNGNGYELGFKAGLGFNTGDWLITPQIGWGILDEEFYEEFVPVNIRIAYSPIKHISIYVNPQLICATKFDIPESVVSKIPKNRFTLSAGINFYF